MKNEIKILKFIRKNHGFTLDEISNKLNLDPEECEVICYHLRNLGYIAIPDGYDLRYITSNGIKYLENRIPIFIKSYIPISLSIIALLFSLISMF